MVVLIFQLIHARPGLRIHFIYLALIYIWKVTWEKDDVIRKVIIANQITSLAQMLVIFKKIKSNHQSGTNNMHVANRSKGVSVYQQTTSTLYPWRPCGVSCLGWGICDTGTHKQVIRKWLSLHAWCSTCQWSVSLHVVYDIGLCLHGTWTCIPWMDMLWIYI